MRRSLQRVTSCGNLAVEVGLVYRHEKTGKLKNQGLILCHDRLCDSCLAHKEITARVELENTIDGFTKEHDDAKIGLLSLGLPPINEMLTLWEIKSVDGFKDEAFFKRYVMDSFVTHIREADTCSFIRAWFRTEEQTISREKKKNKVWVAGNNLNLHWHIVPFMRSVPKELLDEYEMSCFLYLKWLSCYRKACKKFNIKPKHLKPPYRDKNGVLRGGVVFLYDQSLSDDEGRNWLARYVIKKSSLWGIAAEATAKRLKEAKGYTINSLMNSKRKKSFIENAIKMLTLINYNAREYHYSKVKEGRIIAPKKT